jgi:cytosine/adenosine deaminase-related metal-dependent hydrolase
VTLTAHCAPIVLPVTADPIEDGAVLVDGDRIVTVGPRADVVTSSVRVRQWPGVLTPGLVNAHTHLQYTDYADLATSGLPFFTWIRTLTERRMTWSAAQWQESTRHGVHELLRTGTTCVADVVTDVAVLPVLARSGLAGIAYVEVVGVASARWPEVRSDFEHKLAATEPAIGVSPHALYSIGTDVARDAAVLARERGMRLHPHLAETRDEHAYVVSGEGAFAEFARARDAGFELANGGSGCTPVEQADLVGWLGPDSHVAHGVHVSASDRALLRLRGTAVALCARSNEILGAGSAPVREYLDEGNALALGTDSRASAPSLDLRDEMRAHSGVPSRVLVEMATEGGAAALGLSDVGRLAVGARADLAVFDVADGDPYDALLGPGECVATVLAGRIVHRRA